MNEMLHFERALAPLHGVSVDAQGALLGRHDDTLVSVLFEQQAWADAWLGAELQVCVVVGWMVVCGVVWCGVVWCM